MKGFRINTLPQLLISLKDYGTRIDGHNYITAVKNCPKGWRLPTKRELLIIWATSSEEALTDMDLLNRFYWTSSTIQDSMIWDVGFVEGTSYLCKPSERRYIRYVKDINPFYHEKVKIICDK